MDIDATCKSKYIRFFVRLEALAYVAELEGLATVIYREADGSFIFRAWRGAGWQTEYEIRKADILCANFDDGMPAVLTRLSDAFFGELAKLDELKGGDGECR